MTKTLKLMKLRCENSACDISLPCICSSLSVDLTD